MEKELLIKYVEMINRFEKLSKEERSIYSNTEEEKVIAEVRNLIKTNPELSELLKKIHSVSASERNNVINEYYSKQEQEETPKKSEEEEIAKTFGVSVDKIEHKFLSNGKEIFSFYDISLGRQVVLENNKKGKTLVEYLREIQEQNEKYQTENEETNSNNILNDQRIDENLELKMYTKEEILGLNINFNSSANEDIAKLKYLLQNYDRLRIKGIDLENLIYIDEDNKIHEAVINEKQEVTVASLEDANYAAEEYDGASSNEAPEEEDNNDLEAMIDDVETEEVDFELSGSEYEENKNEKEKGKQKVLTKDDKYGFINNVLFVSIITAAILIIALIYFIIRYYA